MGARGDLRRWCRTSVGSDGGGSVYERKGGGSEVWLPGFSIRIL